LAIHCNQKLEVRGIPQKRLFFKINNPLLFILPSTFAQDGHFANLNLTRNYMEENQKKAFDFSADLTKQLITLATAIITLMVTFSKDIIGGVSGSCILYLLLATWALFIISVLFGLLTLGALTANLDPLPGKSQKDKNGVSLPPAVASPILTINSGNIRSTAMMQMVTFFIGLLLTGWYGYAVVSKQQPLVSVSEKHRIYHCKCTDSTTSTDTLCQSR